ncbi:MAG TPA: GAF domain-containing protein, partial [Burkholderiales bacterium]|nr:GAF domain-containing protein [Burkholderiales bacterium]
MLREGAPIGSIGVSRKEPGAFSKHQIRTLETFADEAVIAIENARLFNQTREALEQQTATSEILKVISSSPTTTQPVFESIVKNCHSLFGDSRVALWQISDALLVPRASTGYIPEPMPVDKESGMGACVLESRTIHLPDLRTGAELYPRIKQLGLKHGYLSGVYAPLLREGQAIGGISLLRRQAGAFSDKEVALLGTFADQAVIAIENARLFNETKEALEQQTATSQVLSVISSSPTDVAPVYRTILDNVARLCEANIAALFLYDGVLLRTVAHHNATPPFAKQLDELRVPPSQETPTRRAALERRIVHVEDVLNDPSFSLSPVHREEGPRTVLSVPLLRETALVGVITVWRREPRLFTDKQVALVKTFADQAVIAIENVRLFNETKEALEQQTAISEILRVISTSPTDVKPVLEAVAARAAKICDASDARIFLVDGDQMRHAAGAGDVPVWNESVALSRGSVTGRAIIDSTPVQVVDIEAQAAEFPVAYNISLRSGSRTVLAVPLIRESGSLGAITLRRTDVRPFTDKQTALLKTFADQAAIAIENVRLFNETKESLEQQTATADILKVISRFDTDLQPVFDAIAANALALCRATTGWVYRFDGDLIHIAAAHGLRPEAVEVLRQDYPMRPGRGAATARAILTCGVVYVPNIRDDDEYTLRNLAGAAAYVSALSVPMLLEGKPIGAITVTGAQAGAFTERQIELLQIFAEQAVIAIQNAHLFKEIREKSAQLEVANKHKSEFLANMSHELRTPLNAIIGFSEVLSERMFGEVNEKQLEYLKDIHESGRHLLSLINDILDLSKIEAGRMELEVSTFHLPTALSNAMTLIRERAQRHGIQLGMQVDAQLAEFAGDERKFKQIMLNLLSNAVKFTPDGGQVDVSAKRLNGKVEVAVRDTGIGIAPEDQAAVFEEFRQVGRDKMRTAEGTGLGLALTKRFVELHGGAIRLESMPGKGSTFTVSLPLR